MNFLSRSEQLALYLLENNSTIRKTANHFGLSKSTVHNDLSKRLKYENISLYKNVQILLQKNFSEKHLRGGDATKLKYKKMA